MPDLISEQLSAFFDAELPSEEVALASERLEQEEELKTTWCRYQLIQDVIRQGKVVCHYPELAQNVDLMLESDEEGERLVASSASSQKTNPFLRKRISRKVWGIGIAATVVLFFAVMLFPLLPQGKTSPTDALAKLNGAKEATLMNEWQELPPEMQSRLSGYIMNYDNYSSSERMPGVNPGFVRVVAYER